MKKIIAVLISILFVVSVFSGCAGKKAKEAEKETQETVQDMGWSDIESSAKGKTVNLYMWGGSETINSYVDNTVTPRLKELYDVTINRVPISDAMEMVNKLLTEKEVGKEDGSIDVMWINGENFKICKDNGLLMGSFADRLPNYNEYVDKAASDIVYDFGEKVEGLESPWGKSQFVFVYDSAKIENPPKNLSELKEWIAQNPGKFTYPAPPDFTGSAFIRQTLIDITGGYEQYMEGMDDAQFSQKSQMAWDYLNEIKPYIWRAGATYPESSAKLDQMYSNGEVWMTMSYNPVHAANNVKAGLFPESSRSFVLEGGTLANTHYLSIPFNSKNKEAAMVLVNYMISPQAQIEKFMPENWGDGLAIDVERLSEQDREKVNSIDRGEATLSPEVLKNHRIPELPSQYVDRIEKGWNENVSKN
ncbi:putative spermidine/putrescine transport system substrate-binding protein [Peptoclostridium litorale DSM 5388]|uniref:ABC-type uncharacterized transport system, periplasmic component n=1 Tax=Peptoclostridium litorale DSM 5388 TaxID=1121324 RepID=A0A069RED5_PEPLI|nr:ABC transporter substrate-binding protein [Peptoclostridium litorale]KDR93974.1 ABC-type uncharacterized transport system, periplasmic component [Peptoclostridium litorale DSM 5388]KDR95401.1 ABC-type uncharacterized transport system, periplasmic component [Peptoclostridium litorale DSM 5388]SIN89626.1 putative spermidine/putrescine transport system substrate-binding protein [Peptoclostridium litorale DSM 5388]